MRSGLAFSSGDTPRLVVIGVMSFVEICNSIILFQNDNPIASQSAKHSSKKISVESSGIHSHSSVLQQGETWHNVALSGCHFAVKTEEIKPMLSKHKTTDNS